MSHAESHARLILHLANAKRPWTAMSALAVFSMLALSIQQKTDIATFEDVWVSDCDAQKEIRGRFLSNELPSEAGGFIQDSPPTRLGDYITEYTSQLEAARCIPLASVPIGLQLLDLPPDDEEVLAVFRNAASGWEDEDAGVDSAEKVISRDDWRSVCAVLLEEEGHEGPEDKEDESEVSDEGEDGDGDDDDYVEGPPTASTRRKTRDTKSKTLSMSSLQKDNAHQSAVEAFSLFFPDVSQAELPQQRIMIKDIQRVAKVLGEKIKSDEVSMACFSMHCKC